MQCLGTKACGLGYCYSGDESHTHTYTAAERINVGARLAI